MEPRYKNKDRTKQLIFFEEMRAFLKQFQKHCFRAGSTFFPAVATRHPKYIADAKGWPVLGVRPAFKRARRSSIGRAILDWPGQSKIDPHRFEDGNHFSFDPTVKVFRLERFADFKKKVKCRIAEIVVLCLPAVQFPTRH